ncbi:MAG: DUF371 domain-containing protein [Candidatus Thermoplasmatota archaeon]|nr:DUF371 domain-containing protein [Candidatus Thermoplasmatota archaeon]
MKASFTCRGHPNIRAEHSRTIEFTKDKELTERGDCIIGVSCDFDPEELKKLSGKVWITVQVDEMTDGFRAYINPKFDQDREIVFRKSRVRTQRTLGTDLNKGASKLERSIVERMRDPNAVMHVVLESKGGASYGKG